VQRIYFHGLPFSGLATPFAAHRFGRDKTGVAMQPPAEQDITRKRPRGPGQVHEDDLSHVFGTVRIAATNRRAVE